MQPRTRPPPSEVASENRHHVTAKEGCHLRLQDLVRIFALPAAAALALASCGTGGGVSTPPPGNGGTPPPGGGGGITVRVADPFGSPRPASAFAWQDSNGVWQAGQPGQSTYSFQPSGDRYGFAVRCPDGPVHVYQLTTQDGTSWTVECAADTNTLTASYQVNYDAQAVSAITVCLYDSILPWSCQNSPTGTITMQNRRPGRQDLVLQAYSASSPAMKVLTDVNIPQGSPYTVQVTDADRVTLDGGTLQWSGSAASADAGNVSYLSPLGTWAPLGGGQNGSSRFATLANLSGGRYLADVTTCCQLLNGNEFGGQRYFKLDTATSYSFTLPPWWSGLGFSTSPRPGFTGLSYTGFPNLPTKAYVLQIRLQDDTFWMAALSLNWLGQQTSYTFPDLSGISGFPSLSQQVSWWQAAALAVQFAPGYGQNLRWATSLAGMQTLRRGTRTQQVRSMQGPVPVPGAIEGGGAFRMSQGS
jgi:hypothetical protein